MIQKHITDFLKALKKNNNKEWFDTNRNKYESAREAFIIFVDDLIKNIATFDTEIGHLTAKQCLFRINRDIRFSKNKTPYKSNMSAYFNRAGKKGEGAGYYLHIEPGKSFIAAGIWMPSSANIGKIRQEIDYNYTEWKKITGTAVFKKQFQNGIDMNNTLQRPPKGYDAENPAIAFLKLKSFVTVKSFTDEDLAGKNFKNKIADAFKAVKPVIDFINRSVE